MRHPSARPLFLALVACVASACTRSLDLPDAPLDTGPSVASFAPAHAVAGARIVLTGSHFHAPARVRFGTRTEVDALAVDGASLTVEVPEDASSGPLTVVVDGKEGRSKDSFTFDGVDHLKSGRIAETTDLRVSVVDVWPLADGWHMLLGGSPYSRIADEEPGRGRLRIADSRTVASAWNAERRLLVLADSDPELTCGDGFSGRVWFVSRPFETAAPAPRSTCLPRPGENGVFRLDEVTLSADGSRVLAWSGNFATLLDVETGGVVAKAVNEGEEWTGSAAIPGRFVLADSSHLFQLDPDTGALGDAEEAHADDLSTLAATPDGRLLAGTGSGKVLLYANEWPPRVATTFDSHHDKPIESVAFSGRSERIAAVQEDLARVVVFDASGAQPDGTPVAAATVDEPRHVTCGDDGVFRVGHAGGFSLFSDTTGALLETRAVHADLSHVVLRQRTPGDPSDLVATVASKRFSRVFQLARGESDFGAPDIGDHAAAEALAVAASPSALSLYVSREGSVGHVDLDRGRERDDRFPLPAGTRVAGDLAVSPDGGAVAFVVDGGVSRVAWVLDDKANWSASPGTRIAIDDGDGVEAIAFDRAGHLVAWSENTVRVLDAQAARQGTAKDVYPALTFDSNIRWAGSVGGDVLVATDDFSWWRLDATGQRSLASPPEAQLVSPQLFEGTAGPVFSPFGRRVSWLADDVSLTNATVSSIAFDLASGLPIGDMPDLLLPFGTSGFELLPDGEHAVASNPVDDLLYWLE